MRASLLRFLTLGAVLFLLPLTALSAVAPVQGNVPTQVFTPLLATGKPQLRDVWQAPSGVLYFASSQGLLEFDGEHWNLTPLEPRASQGSGQRRAGGLITLAPVHDDMLVAGGEDELGYFERGIDGWVYTSLVAELAADGAPLGDVRQVWAAPGELVFLTRFELVVWRYEDVPAHGYFVRLANFQTQALPPVGVRLYEADGELVVTAPGGALSVLREGALEPLPHGDFVARRNVLGMFADARGRRVLIDSRAGFFVETSAGYVPWQGAPVALLAGDRVAGFLTSGARHVVLTAFGDLVVWGPGEEGARRVTTQLPGGSMLQQGAIGIDGGLWFCAGRDALRLDLDSNSEWYNNTHGLFGQVLSVARHQSDLFVGTIDGLYQFMPGHDGEQKAGFKMISPATLGCRAILSLGEHLVVSNQAGVNARGADGVWRGVHSGLVDCLVAARDGRSFFVGKPGGELLRYSREADGWQISGRWDLGATVTDVVETEQGELWCVTRTAGGTSGLVLHDPRGGRGPRAFDALSGLDTRAALEPVWYQGELLVGTPAGAQRFNPTTERFERIDEALGRFGKSPLPPPLLLSPRVDPAGRLWFLQDATQPAYVTSLAEDAEVRMPFEWLGERTLRDFVFDGDDVWAASSDGRLVRLQHDTGPSGTRAAPLLALARPGALEREPERVAYAFDRQGVYTFEYSIASFANRAMHHYQTRLIGVDEGWQPWAPSASRTVRDLDVGDYTFEVRAWTPAGGLSDIATLKVEILPPWYRTRLASVLGVLLLVGGVSGLVSWRMRLARARVRELEAEVNQRIRAEEERDALEGELRQAQKLEAIGTFAAGVAHDFNNSLTAILGFTDLIRRQKRVGVPIDDALNSIQHAAEQASGVTRGLLTFSHKAKIERRVLDLGALVGQAVDLVGVTLHARIEVHVELAEDVLVEADGVQIEQVVMNLVSNARDAMLSGGRLDVVVRRSTPEEDARDGADAPRALLAVRDSGSGIPEAVRERIFDPFFTTKGREQGTGLGMSIVLGIVEGHGGAIRLSPPEEAGTEITVTLPLATGPVTAQPTRRRRRDVDAPGTKVLIVEDNDEVRQLMVSTLSMVGFEVVTASDGDEALERFHEHLDELAMVFLDLDLPKRSGAECLRLIRETDPAVPVLIVTGKVGDLSGVFDPPPPRVLAKPFRPLELHDVIGEMLGGLDHN